eukprot:363570-Chlamydomonas_euryale.AAC.4
MLFDRCTSAQRLASLSQSGSVVKDQRPYQEAQVLAVHDAFPPPSLRGRGRPDHSSCSLVAAIPTPACCSSLLLAGRSIDAPGPALADQITAAALACCYSNSFMHESICRPFLGLAGESIQAHPLSGES